MSNKEIIGYVPKMDNYLNLTPFQVTLIQNFPFLCDDFDSLGNVGFLNKVIENLNKVIENENIVSDNTRKLYQAFVDLRNYIQNYFKNLDVQDEINNKLDEMALDGTLAQLINEHLPTEISDIKENKIALTSRLILKNANKTEIELQNIQGSIQGLCFDETHNFLYRAFISSGQNGGVNKYNASTGELLATTGIIENFGHSNCLCYYNNKIYVTNSRVGDPSLGGMGVRVLKADDLSVLGSFRAGSLGAISAFGIQNVQNENSGNVSGRYSYVLAMCLEAAYRPKITLLKSCNKITDNQPNLSLKNMSPYRAFNYDHNLHTTQGACLKYPFIFVPLSGISGQPTNKIVVYNIFGQKICEMVFEDMVLNLTEIEDLDVSNDYQTIYVGFVNNKVCKFEIGYSLSSMAQFMQYSCGTTIGKYPLTCLASFNPDNTNNEFVINNSANYPDIKLIKDMYFTPFNYASTHIQGNKILVECGIRDRVSPTVAEESQIHGSYKSTGKCTYEFIIRNTETEFHRLIVEMSYNLIDGHIAFRYFLDNTEITTITDEIGAILTPSELSNYRKFSTFGQIYLYSTGYFNNDTFYNGSYSYEDLT